MAAPPRWAYRGWGIGEAGRGSVLQGRERAPAAGSSGGVGHETDDLGDSFRADAFLGLLSVRAIGLHRGHLLSVACVGCLSSGTRLSIYWIVYSMPFAKQS